MKPTGAALSDNYRRWQQEGGINLQSEICMINNTVLDMCNEAEESFKKPKNKITKFLQFLSFPKECVVLHSEAANSWKSAIQRCLIVKVEPLQLLISDCCFSGIVNLMWLKSSVMQGCFDALIFQLIATRLVYYSKRNFKFRFVEFPLV